MPVSSRYLKYYARMKKKSTQSAKCTWCCCSYFFFRYLLAEINASIIYMNFVVSRGQFCFYLSLYLLSVYDYGTRRTLLTPHNVLINLRLLFNSVFVFMVRSASYSILLIVAWQVFWDVAFEALLDLSLAPLALHVEIVIVLHCITIPCLGFLCMKYGFFHKQWQKKNISKHTAEPQDNESAVKYANFLFSLFLFDSHFYLYK